MRYLSWYVGRCIVIIFKGILYGYVFWFGRICCCYLWEMLFMYGGRLCFLCVWDFVSIIWFCCYVWILWNYVGFFINWFNVFILDGCIRLCNFMVGIVRWDCMMLVFFCVCKKDWYFVVLGYLEIWWWNL